MRLWIMLFVLAGLASVPSAASGAADERPLVLAIKLNSEINPVSASFVKDSIDRAKSDHAAALVILLDTPGGLSTSMQDIYKAELASSVPVIVYVSPDGARAASAGVYVTMAADVAAMAPVTNIGSATPIDSNGSEHRQGPAQEDPERRREEGEGARRHARPKRRRGGAHRLRGGQLHGQRGARQEPRRLRVPQPPGAPQHGGRRDHDLQAHHAAYRRTPRSRRSTCRGRSSCSTS